MKKDYISKLERWARWMLPAQEADEVLADYRDIVSDPELLQGLGKPRSVIKPLAQPRQYYTWLAVFVVMAVCVLALGLCPTSIGFPIWAVFFRYGDRVPYGAPTLAVLGAVLALVWFRRKGRKKGRLPRAVPVLLAVFLVFFAGVMWFCWACSQDLDAFLAMWGTVRPFIGPNTTAPASVYVLRMVMCYGGAVISLAGAFALGKARLGDRRWAAVYVLALAAILASLSVVYLTVSMDVTAVSTEALFRSMLARCSVIAVIGLVGTGVALC